MIAVVHPKMSYNKEAGQFLINSKNLIQASIYYTVRHCIRATWLNDRDQFLFPNTQWQNDLEFQNKVWDISKLKAHRKGRASVLPFSVTLTELMGTIIKM